jgi:hypothetical protein
MSNNQYLMLQLNIIRLLLALIGIIASIEHPNWFGGAPESTLQNGTLQGHHQQTDRGGF